MNFNVREILEGVRNDLIPPSHLKDIIKYVSEERLSICRECPFNSENAKKNGYKTIRFDEHCIQCGCNLKKKTKCLSCQCPLTPPKWTAHITHEERTDQLKDIENEELPD